MPSSSRRLPLFLAAAVLGLLGLSAWDPDGLRKVRRLEAEVQRRSGETRDLARENARLRREIRALQGEPSALERAAREDLGFVRPGELVFKLDEGGR
ncbi:MAG: septum formation initiator family protein [Deltaproteobacteria bacterium]|nr:septum formation initiator family protein [Deltaproteobacteria bacterium]